VTSTATGRAASSGVCRRSSRPARALPRNSVFVLFARRGTGTLHCIKLGSRGFPRRRLVAQRIGPDRPSPAPRTFKPRGRRHFAGSSPEQRRHASATGRAEPSIFGSRSTRTVDGRPPGLAGLRSSASRRAAGGKPPRSGRRHGRRHRRLRSGDGDRRRARTTRRSCGSADAGTVARLGTGLDGRPPQCAGARLGEALDRPRLEFALRGPVVHGCKRRAVLVL